MVYTRSFHVLGGLQFTFFDKTVGLAFVSERQAFRHTVVDRTQRRTAHISVVRRTKAKTQSAHFCTVHGKGGGPYTIFLLATPHLLCAFHSYSLFVPCPRVHLANILEDALNLQHFVEIRFHPVAPVDHLVAIARDLEPLSGFM